MQAAVLPHSSVQAYELAIFVACSMQSSLQLPGFYNLPKAEETTSIVSGCKF